MKRSKRLKSRRNKENLKVNKIQSRRKKGLALRTKTLNIIKNLIKRRQLRWFM